MLFVPVVRWDRFPVIVPAPTDPRDPWSRPPFWAGRSPVDRHVERWERDRARLDELRAVRDDLARIGHQAGSDEWRTLHRLMNALEHELGLSPTSIESPTWYTGGRRHGGEGGIDDSIGEAYNTG